MRPLLSLLICCLLMGGVFAYTRFADSVRRIAVAPVIEYAQDEFAVEIHQTFDAIPDPVLGTDSLIVKFKGKTVLRRSDEISADQVSKIQPLTDVEMGQNELFVSASRSPAGPALAVLHVVVSKNGNPIAETSLVSQPGLPMIAGPVFFFVEAIPPVPMHDH
jgi:hypothetical protein